MSAIADLRVYFWDTFLKHVRNLDTFDTLRREYEPPGPGPPGGTVAVAPLSGVGSSPVQTDITMTDGSMSFKMTVFAFGVSQAFGRNAILPEIESGACEHKRVHTVSTARG